MAMINCPECDKSISSKSFKCTNCGIVINKPKRSITGIIFKGLFIIFNVCMLLLIVALFLTGEGEAAGVVAGIGTGVVIFIWVIIGLPLALMNYLTRPAAYE